MPTSWAQQHNAPLQRGIRTGLCGSITTFSSWTQQMGIMVVNGRVLQAIFGMLVGLQAALVSCAAPASTFWDPSQAAPARIYS